MKVRRPYAIVNPKLEPELKEWAIGILGTLIGYWLRERDMPNTVPRLVATPKALTDGLYFECDTDPGVGGENRGRWTNVLHSNPRFEVVLTQGAALQSQGKGLSND